jgi:hypothetical protein
MDNNQFTLYYNNVKICISQIDTIQHTTQNNEQENIKRANEEPVEQKPQRIERKAISIKELHAQSKGVYGRNKDVKYRAAMKIVGEQMKQQNPK